MQCLAILLVLCLGPLCFGESVVVQVLNGRDGTPVPDQFVTMKLRNANATTMVALNSRTDANGEARFQLPQTLPTALDVEVALTQPGLHCPSHLLGNTERVMHDGLMVAARMHGSKLSAPIQTAPGHIVFVARPSLLLEKVLFE
jgi:hypothetical protein